jgi:Protein of unknown function (DUF1214)
MGHLHRLSLSIRRRHPNGSPEPSYHLTRLDQSWNRVLLAFVGLATSESRPMKQWSSRWDNETAGYQPPAPIAFSCVISAAQWRTSSRRALILNEQKITDRSSPMDLRKNADGSIDIYCGPEALAGFETNWIPTVPGKNWFAYFRFYQPTEAYFDRSWPLPDFEQL